MDKTAVRTESAPAPFQGAPYSQAIKANGFVFVSGQLGLTPGHSELAGDTIEEQTRQIFDNLEAILTEAGSGLDRIVKTTVFLDLARRLPGDELRLRGAGRRHAACAVDDRGLGPPVGRARRDRGHRPRLTPPAMALAALARWVPTTSSPMRSYRGICAHVCDGTRAESGPVRPGAEAEWRRGDPRASRAASRRCSTRSRPSATPTTASTSSAARSGTSCSASRASTSTSSSKATRSRLANDAREEARRARPGAPQVRHRRRPLRRRRAGRRRHGAQRVVPRARPRSRRSSRARSTTTSTAATSRSTRWPCR